LSASSLVRRPGQKRSQRSGRVKRGEKLGKKGGQTCYLGSPQVYSLGTRGEYVPQCFPSCVLTWGCSCSNWFSGAVSLTCIWWSHRHCCPESGQVHGQGCVYASEALAVLAVADMTSLGMSPYPETHNEQEATMKRPRERT
jgi:hypothetical protein